MKTVHKIAAARMAYRAIHGARAMLGRTDHQVVARDGIRFDLDLAEGIDFSIYLVGVFERRTARALNRLVEPSSLVIDIGANIGAHTLRLARLVGPHGRVLAFEPTDFAFQKLQRNLGLNPTLASRVDAFHCFLTEGNDVSVPGAIYSSWPLAGGTELHAKHLGHAMPTEAASARSLDDVLTLYPDRRVQLVKLDVDGFECQVLRGARLMLREVRPIFVMELAPYVLEERGASLRELLSFFIPNGYVLFDEQGRPLRSTAEELQQLIGDGASINVIARVP
jgi:FkbM family methyltransferase